MTDLTHTPEAALKRLKWPLRLTLWGMLAERATRAFWPLWTVLFAALVPVLFGWHESAGRGAVIAAVAVVGLALLWALIAGLRNFRVPTRDEALARLDATLPGRPITALGDAQAIGAGDAASEYVWRAHVARMAERAREARAVRPDLRLSTRDPYGLRYVAVIGLAVALVFGTLGRVATVGESLTAPGAALAGGPAWEGWVEPPAYTGKPGLYLNDIAAAALEVPQGSRVTLRLYGQPGTLGLRETVSGAPLPQGGDDMTRRFDVVQSGEVEVTGPGGRAWDVAMAPDRAPSVSVTAPMERGRGGEIRQSFQAQDDHGVVAGRVTITLDLDALDRRHGLAADPEPRAPIVVDLPMPITGDRADFEEVLVENFSQHPWARLPVRMVFEVEDALGQTGQSAPVKADLGGRRFFDPMAAALIEMRRDLLWTRANAPRAVQILRAITHRPDEVFRTGAAYLPLRVAMRRLAAAQDDLDTQTRDEIAQVLWDIAVMLEDGGLSDALERLHRAQDRLSEAMRRGADEAEIAELMEELQQAMRDYMRQLAEQSQQEGQQTDQAENQNMQEVTSDQLQQMLDRIQELMEQGRMAEAQQLLDQLRQMMENMQVTQGEGQQSPGQQAMEGLAETLRDQQGLSDDAFRDLQEQFDPGANAGQSEGQDGRGQTPEGQGQGDGQQQPGEGGQPGEQSLADRQRALRQELDRQQRQLPGLGGEQGQATREALDRAGRAMDDAEQALRDEDIAGALDSQAEAMEALREGMRNLGEALAEQQLQQGQQGDAMGQARSEARRDPLGRESGAQGPLGTDENLLQGEDVYGRARELLDEIRRRSSEQDRPAVELDYLRRLLDRF